MGRYARQYPKFFDLLLSSVEGGGVRHSTWKIPCLRELLVSGAKGGSVGCSIRKLQVMLRVLNLYQLF